MSYYSLNEARDLVIEAGLKLQKTGLIVRTWGNISARISDEQYVITPSGRSYDSLKREDIVIVDRKDNSYLGSIKPSSERPVHSAVYTQRQDAGFVIHTHQAFASALSVLGKNFDDIYCAEYGPNGSSQLSDAVQSVLIEHPAIHSLLMRNHGAVGYGATLEEAFKEIEELESACREICRHLLKRNNLISQFMTAKQLDAAIDLGIQTVECTDRIGKSAAPFILLAAAISDHDLDPYLDDQAQILGVNVPLVDLRSKSSLSQRLDEAGVVILKGNTSSESYAIVKTDNPDDTAAALFILDKACLASVIARTVPGITPLDPVYALEDRRAYVESYSKLIVSNV